MIVKRNEMSVEGEIVGNGDSIRIDGEKGQKFTFLHHTINTDTGAEWVDVIHNQKGLEGPFRSFRTSRARLVKRKKKNG